MSRQAASHRTARELHGTARDEHGIALLTNAEELTGSPMPSKGNAQLRYAPKRKGIELNRLDCNCNGIAWESREKLRDAMERLRVEWHSNGIAYQICDRRRNGTARRKGDAKRSGAKEVHRTVMHGDTLIWALN